jgi:hypothetical protein
MKPKEITSGPAGLVTLLGGDTVEVTLQDGKSESVKVLQLPIKTYPQLFGCLTEEIRKLELYTGKPKEWVEQLTPASHELLITTGDGINMDFFGRWLDRKKAAESLVPKQDMAELAEIAAVVERLQKTSPGLVDSLIAKLPGKVSILPSGSSKSPLPAG